MYGQRFYNQTTRRYIALFGTLFNDIEIIRYSTERETAREGSVDDVLRSKASIIKVPVNYGPSQKFLSRLDQDPNLSAQAITLPRISFEISNLTYDGTRKLTSSMRNKAKRSLGSTASFPDAVTQFTPSPYNLDIEMNIMTKYAEDGTKILEQILPFFQPQQTLSVRLVDYLETYFDVPIILNSISTQDTYEGDYESRRALIWTLNFTIKGYYFGPSYTKKIVKFVRSNIFDDTEDSPNLVALGDIQQAEIINDYVKSRYSVYLGRINEDVFGVVDPANSYDLYRNTPDDNVRFSENENVPTIFINKTDTLVLFNESDEPLYIVTRILNSDGIVEFNPENIPTQYVENAPALNNSSLEFTVNDDVFTDETFFYITESGEVVGIINVLNIAGASPEGDAGAQTPDNSGKIVNLGDNPSSIIHVKPGLTPDGQPTSNPSKSIDYDQIDFDDDWGYIVEIKDGDGYLDDTNGFSGE
jgi:hypothetical protein